jgi:hypothetical protein
MEEKVVRVVSKLGIYRPDTREFLKKLVHYRDPFQALTCRDIGKMIPTQTGNRRDREVVRKEIARPLIELGLLEKVTRRRNGSILKGHPIAKSPNCAYRLTVTFWKILNSERPLDLLDDTLRRRVHTQDICAGDASSHERLMDACVDHLARIHLGPGHKLVYRDPSHGPRVDLENLLMLSAAGLTMDPVNDPCPDLVFWNESDGSLCVVEAVMTEGAIDDRRHRILRTWIASHQPAVEVTYVTAFGNWRTASTFMRTLSKTTRAWVWESPFDLWICA